MVALPGSDANSAVFRFEVKNRGTKAARDFYWHLCLPAALGATPTGRPDQNYGIRGAPDISGVPYQQYGDHFKEPVYPGRSVPVAAVAVSRTRLLGPNEARWRVAAEDGIFPPGAEGFEGFGTIELLA